jgi:hypothetical protein
MRTLHSKACLMLSTSASLINSSKLVPAVAKYREVHRRLPSDLISRTPRSLSLPLFISWSAPEVDALCK